jgi:hypothetical protein
VHVSSYWAQLIPQPPQFPSTDSSTHVLVHRMLFARGQHVEFVQLPFGQDVPQLPQLAGSLVVSVHVPGASPQSVGVPAGQPEAQPESVQTGVG